MKKSNRVKRWRLNVLVIYYEPISANFYRFNIIQILKHLSSIYRLDYAISESHQFPLLSDSLEKSADKPIVDLVYFRSNENSRVDVKELRSLINSMFHRVPSQFVEGVEICTQLYKFLPEYPFPNDFFRPLEYPYIEFYNGSNKTVYICSNEVMKVIEEEQNYPLN